MDRAMELSTNYTRAWREANVLYAEWAKKHGLSYSELLVIIALYDTGGKTLQKDICSQYLMQKQTVNTILKNFSARGWIFLEEVPGDKRRKAVCLTQEGKEVVRQVIGELARCEKEAWEGLGEKGSDTLVEYTRWYNKLFREATEREFLQ